jgi:hypothetical protein
MQVLGNSHTADVLILRALPTASIGAVCEFTLTVIDATGTRSDQVTVTITVIPSTAPLLSLDYSNFVTNCDQFLRIRAVVELPLGTQGVLKWSADSGLNLPVITLTPLSVNM